MFGCLWLKKSEARDTVSGDLVNSLIILTQICDYNMGIEHKADKKLHTKRLQFLSNYSDCFSDI